MGFEIVLALVSVLAGAIAALAGFGIGSLLTPLLAVDLGTKLAVALVSVPHFVATASRLASLWREVDWRVFFRFGVLSATGGLVGALLHSTANSPALTIAFGALLVFAGVSTLSGFASRMRFGRSTAWFAGALSGLFGGLVGNQGGIRSAALLGFEIRKEPFVATATAVGVVVDLARMPIYVATQAREMREALPLIVIATAGTLVGTFWGVRLLRRVPERAFRSGVGIIIALLGLFMLLNALSGRS